MKTKLFSYNYIYSLSRDTKKKNIKPEIGNIFFYNAITLVRRSIPFITLHSGIAKSEHSVV